MKKLLTLMLLMSGMNMFGAAFGGRPDAEIHFANTTGMDVIHLIIPSPFYRPNPRGRSLASVNRRSKNPIKLNLDVIEILDYHPESEPPIYITLESYKEKPTITYKSAKFASSQENGKKYYLMENKWDNDTDYVIISEEDLEKKGSVPLPLQLVIKQIEKNIDEKTFSDKDLETLRAMPALLLTDKINNFIKELNKEAEEKERCEERFGGPPCNIM